MSRKKIEELKKQREEMRKERQENKELLVKLIEIKEKGKRVTSESSTEIKEEQKNNTIGETVTTETVEKENLLESKNNEQEETVLIPENPTEIPIENESALAEENETDRLVREAKKRVFASIDESVEKAKKEFNEEESKNPTEIPTDNKNTPKNQEPQNPEPENNEPSQKTSKEKEGSEEQTDEEKAKLEKEQKIKELENEILSISLKMPFGESIEVNQNYYEGMKEKNATIAEFAPLVEFAYKQLENLKRMRELKSELDQIKEPETKIIQDSENEGTESVKNKLLNIFSSKENKKTETPKEKNITQEENTPAPEKTEKKKIGARIFGFVKNIFKNKKEEKLNDTETERKENGNFLWIKKENKEKYAFFETEIDGQKIKLEISEQKKGVLYNKFLSFFSKEFKSNWKLSLTNFFDDKLYEHTPYVNNVKYFFYDSVLHKNAKKEIIALAESIKNEILNIKSEEKENKEEKIKKLIEEIKNIQTNTIWKEIEKIKKLKEDKFNFIATDYMHKINIDTAKTLVKKHKASSLYLNSIEELSPEVVDILISSNNYETIEFLNLKTDKLSDKTIEMLGKFQGKYESVNSSLKKFLEHIQEKYREDQKNKNN